MPRGKRKTDDLGELNLAPIMALLVVLIPVLLFAFNFFEVKIQAVQAPKMGKQSKKKKENEKKPLNLTVFIKNDGFYLKMQSELVGEPEPPILKRTVDGKEVYDYAALYTRLAAIKTEYKDEKTINIGGLETIPWHIIAKTIDAARVRLEKDAYTDLKEYSTAKPKTTKDEKGVKKSVQLFPAVVFVVAE